MYDTSARIFTCVSERIWASASVIGASDAMRSSEQLVSTRCRCGARAERADQKSAGSGRRRRCQSIRANGGIVNVTLRSVGEARAGARRAAVARFGEGRRIQVREETLGRRGRAAKREARRVARAGLVLEREDRSMDWMRAA